VCVCVCVRVCAYVCVCRVFSNESRHTNGSEQKGVWCEDLMRLMHGSCSSSKHDLEAVRLELARERTRRRALEQEKEKLEAMLIQASRTGGSSGGGMLIDLGEIASPRGLLMKDTSRGSRVGTPRGDVGSPMGPHSSAYRQGLGGDLTPRGQTRGGSPMSSPRGTKQHDLTPRGLSSWT
jgi:hypothetical protein